jgi:uncharacterized membrane protein YfcA
LRRRCQTLNEKASFLSGGAHAHPAVCRCAIRRSHLDLLPVRHLRHGRRDAADGDPAAAHAFRRRHGAARRDPDGLVWRAWLWRSHIAWRIAAYYALGAINAALGFAAIAVVPDKATALIILGLLPVVGLMLPRRLTPDISHPVHGFGCGVVCTALQFMAGVSGPVLDVYFVRSNLDRRQLVATKAAIQGLGHFLKVAYFGQLLVAGTDTVAPAAIVLAVALALVGTQLSRRALDAISDIQFRLWTRRLIAAIAAVYLIQGVVLAVQGHSPAEAVAAMPASGNGVVVEQTP